MISCRHFLLCMLIIPIPSHAFPIENQPEEKNIAILQTPPDFGKKHFIIGMSPEQIQEIQQEATRLPKSQSSQAFDLIVDGKVKQAFFAPDDRIHDIIIHLLESENSWIKVAAFMLTDKSIAQALAAAQERGVQVEVVVDPGCSRDKFNKIDILREKNCQVYVYNPNYNGNNKNSMITSLMHNKFIILGNNIAGKLLLLTGSLNLTNSAHKIHQENILIIEDGDIIAKYVKQFDILIERSGKKRKQSITTAQKRKKERLKLNGKKSPQEKLQLAKKKHQNNHIVA